MALKLLLFPALLPLPFFPSSLLPFFPSSLLPFFPSSLLPFFKFMLIPRKKKKKKNQNFSAPKEYSPKPTRGPVAKLLRNVGIFTASFYGGYLGYQLVEL